MTVDPGRQARSFGPLGAGATGLARLCLVAGMCSIFLVMAGAAAPEPARDLIYWIQRAVVALAILTLLVVFFRHPWPSQRPAGLTEVLAYSPMLFLATWVTGVWPGVFVAPLIPLLAVGAWITERARRD
ncbi:hypothetical protein [Streptomyces mutabilis]|uniref:hypothetical protein n=1 Tax=Streptomyces mutabilis TaxID=67332 RepID=UPI0034DF954C